MAHPQQRIDGTGDTGDTDDTDRYHCIDGDGDGRVPIRALLAEPPLRGRLLGGEAGLGRTVSWCLPLSEVRLPTVADGATLPRDLSGVAVHLPTTALAGAEEPGRLVAELDLRGAAALLAWPPPEGPGPLPELAGAAKAADEARLPLLLLCGEADYRVVSRLVGQKALAQTSHVLEYSARVHRALAEVLARGSGIPAMVRAVAGLARCPVMVMDADGETLACARFGSPGPDPGEIGGLLAERLPELRVPRDGFETAVGLIELDLRRESSSEATHVMIAPIVVGGDLYGRLVLIEASCPPDEHDLAQHRVIAEHGATLTGSEMLRQRSIRAAEERAKGDFVESLVHGRFADPHELEARARHHGFDVAGRFAVLAVTAAALLPTGRRDERRAAAVTRIAQAVEPVAGRWTMAAAVGTFVVVIRQISDGAGHADPLAEQDAVAHFAQQLHRALRPHLGDDVRVTSGRSGHGAAGVAASYYEARVAMGLARHTGASPVCGYDDLRVYAALREVAGSQEGRTFAREILQALRRVHSQTGDLEQVVIAYIKSAGNLNAAARMLKLHRNTMLYKLDRASRALRMDIRSADTQFMVWLAHHIDTLASVTGALSDELSPPAEDVLAV
ncbi:PucR family transcriptional regulator [Microtetraspora glauca]|uniref:Helix-turn-helix domain-containing protein n=1 Tax=Microtetraspora glauca TaxID=1996 RepID=A0ABV3GH29_MICGL